MNPRELAAHYDAKVFESGAAAEAAGYVLTDTMSPRNTWNKASAAQAIIARLLPRRASGEAAAIGLVIDSRSVTGCYQPARPAAATENQ